MSNKILILGGLGNGSVIANAIVDANKRGDKEWEFCGYLNDRMEVGSQIEEFPVLGKTTDCSKFLDKGYYFINTIFRIDGQQDRIDLFENLQIPEERLATFIHPMTYIAPNVKLGFGTVVMPNVSISSGTVFGNGCLIMVGATIGHDNKIGKYCHFAAQCCVGAYTQIGDGAHVGLNATTRENIVIGKHATLGMGSVLTKSVGENEIWVGNPAKFLRMAE
ncbi:MAG: NeuD/PglB/VioB family sugar acetyltransferase [Salinivirgaceae bacterium]|nr:NeuD/PglB/VioB family sugar acetyltransferase [Salinivirgaceae bacterium]